MNQVLLNIKEELLKVLGKGMVTLSKKWRQKLSIEISDIVKARKEDNKVIIEAQPQAKPFAPFRVISYAEIDEFLDEDVISEALAHKVQTKHPSTLLA